MLVALAVVATLDAVASPTVELTLAGSGGAPVSAAPRSLSDVARERREGRRAVGGFSAVETTVTRGSFVVPAVAWEEEEERAEPEVPPAPEPPGLVVPYVGGWVDAGYGGAPRRRPPHVRHHGRPSMHSAPGAGFRPSPRPVVRPASPRAFSPHAGTLGRGGRRPG